MASAPPGDISALLLSLSSPAAADRAAAAGQLACLCNAAVEARSLGPLQQLLQQGGVPALVRLLGGEQEAADNAAGVLYILAGGLPASSAAIVGAGGLPILLRLLRAPSVHAHLNAAGALGALARGSAARQRAIVAGGGALALVQLLGSCIDIVQMNAAGALFHLADLPEACAAIAAAGGVHALLAVLRSSGSEEACRGAALALARVAHAQPAACTAAARQGGVAAVAKHLTSGVPDLRRVAASLMAGFAQFLPELRAAQAAAIPALVQLVQRPGDPAAAQSAVAALYHLALDSPERCLAIAAAGGADCMAHALSAELPLIEDDADRQEVASVLQGLAAARSEAAAQAALSGQQAQQAQQAQQVQQVQQAQPTIQPPPRVCAAPGCGATSKLRRCGGCGAVRYCSEACSKAHWRAHKPECRGLQAEKAAAAAAAVPTVLPAS